MVHMKELTKRPVFFERNRVWRVYKGGLQFHYLMGDPPEDNHFPEEWVASTVKAENENSLNPLEGLSVIQNTDITLKELIEQFPEETVAGAGSLEVLVKYLDSAVRLPMQAHPDRAFSEKYFNSSYGKTEMWLILATRENASICFGFKEKLTKEKFSELIELSKEDPWLMDGYLNRIPVAPGEVYLIPAKAVHAIGAGCLILEVQEPTDFTIQPEFWCGEHMLSYKEMYMDLPKEEALDCFDYELYGEDCIKKSVKKPTVLEEQEAYKKEALITQEDTPCFSVMRYQIKTQMCLSEAPAIYVVSEGEAKIVGEDYERPVKRGDYFFLPRDAGEKFLIECENGRPTEIICCMPPVR